MPKPTLDQFLPPNCESIILNWLKEYSLHLTITRERLTKLGDFRPAQNGFPPRISVNGNLNIYSFLITLVHEISHASAYNKFGRRILPHGNEWKNEIRTNLQVFINNNVFPEEVKFSILNYLKNPKASSMADRKLVEALRKYDLEEEANDGKLVLNEIEEGIPFILPNGMLLIKGEKRRTRYLCHDPKTKRKYTVSSLVRVLPID
jgi:hypothetical protein